MMTMDFGGDWEEEVVGREAEAEAELQPEPEPEPEPELRPWQPVKIVVSRPGAGLTAEQQALPAKPLDAGLRLDAELHDAGAAAADQLLNALLSPASGGRGPSSSRRTQDSYTAAHRPPSTSPGAARTMSFDGASTRAVWQADFSVAEHRARAERASLRLDEAAATGRAIYGPRQGQDDDDDDGGGDDEKAESSPVESAASAGTGSVTRERKPVSTVAAAPSATRAVAPLYQFLPQPRLASSTVGLAHSPAERGGSQGRAGTSLNSATVFPLSPWRQPGIEKPTHSAGRALKAAQAAADAATVTPTEAEADPSTNVAGAATAPGTNLRAFELSPLPQNAGSRRPTAAVGSSATAASSDEPTKANAGVASTSTSTGGRFGLELAARSLESTLSQHQADLIKLREGGGGSGGEGFGVHSPIQASYAGLTGPSYSAGHGTREEGATDTTAAPATAIAMATARERSLSLGQRRLRAVEAYSPGSRATSTAAASVVSSSASSSTSGPGARGPSRSPRPKAVVSTADGTGVFSRSPTSAMLTYVELAQRPPAQRTVFSSTGTSGAGGGAGGGGRSHATKDSSHDPRRRQTSSGVGSKLSAAGDNVGQGSTAGTSSIGISSIRINSISGSGSSSSKVGSPVAAVSPFRRAGASGYGDHHRSWSPGARQAPGGLLFHGNRAANVGDIDDDADAAGS